MNALCAEPYDAPRPYSEQTESCYTLLGPVARSWFRFIDCAQVLQLPLRARFDLIWLPTAQYQRPEVVAKLREFVAQGGTLVCTDPLAFATDTLGRDTAASRQELFGVTVGETTGPRRLRPVNGSLGGELTLPGAAYALAPSPGVAVLATYEDGSPALTAHRVGEGQAILFGSNPLAFSAVADRGWREFFTRFAVEYLKMPGNQVIWRFRFPDSVLGTVPSFPGSCLTGNHVLWAQEQADSRHNVDTGGAYKLFPVPEAMPDARAGEPIAFGDGHLTDRRTAIKSRKTAAYRAAPYALPASRWMVSWAAADPAAAVFDLKQPCVPREARLWYCDASPEVTVTGSADGQLWQPLGQARGEVAGEDVLELRVPMAGARPYRYVKLLFAVRKPGEKLTLVEAELWGEVAGQ